LKVKSNETVEKRVIFCSSFITILSTFKARRHRNELMHNACYEITKAKLNEYLTDFQVVLKVTNNSNERVFPQAEVEQPLKALIEVSCLIQYFELHI
jgi:hypothetical protein